MLHVILSILKVLLRNGDVLIELIQEVYAEVRGETEAQKDLDALKSETLIDPKTGEVM